MPPRSKNPRGKPLVWGDDFEDARVVTDRPDLHVPAVVKSEPEIVKDIYRSQTSQISGPVVPPSVFPETNGGDSEALRFLVITDNHVGFLEEDGIRGKDALISFEEALQIAKVEKVDFILHAGDLFDINRPSQESLCGVMRAIAKYCSDPETTQANPLEIIDWGSSSVSSLKPNAIPILMIHGNHDDPGGVAQVAAADILSAGGLVTYIGKQTSVEDDMEISPLLLQKGSTKVALYGLGNLKDERLHRAFVNGKVRFLAPEDDWFGLMAIHQNRFRGNANGAPSKNCVLESFLPSCLDLVVWGHEHEAKPIPEPFIEAGFHVLQPGSSVATALTQAESKQKGVVLVEVIGKQFRCIQIPLLTVRPLIVADAGDSGLTEQPVPDTGKSANKGLPPRRTGSVTQQRVNGPVHGILNQIEALAAQGALQAETQLKAREHWLNKNSMCSLFSHDPTLFARPIIRLKVSAGLAASAGLEKTTNQKFGLQFSDKIANPESIIQVVRKLDRKGDKKRALAGLEIVDCESVKEGGDIDFEPEEEESVQDIVFRCLEGSEGGDHLLDLFAEPDLNEALVAFVSGQENAQLDRFVRSSIDVAMKAAVHEIGGVDKFDPVLVSERVRGFLKTRTELRRKERLGEDVEKDVCPAPEIVAENDLWENDEPESNNWEEQVPSLPPAKRTAGSVFAAQPAKKKTTNSQVRALR